MAVQAVPAGFHTITPYLIVKDAMKLIEFLKNALRAEVRHLSQGPDGSVMHATVRIGDSMLMMTDAREKWPAQPTGMYLYVPDVDAWYRRAIAAGAESINEPRDEFYGDRMGGIKDPSGNMWWIASHVEDVSEEEMERRREKMFGGKGKS